jgi:O-antigen/teichoic acid export membrane protein
LQALVILAGGWILLRGQLRDLSVVPLRWRYATFRRILTYSVLFQINNVLVLIIDPMVKFLLARFGGLSATAYMDMAMQLVQKIRQLPMAATQVLVPAMAQASELGQGRVRELYTRSYRTIFAATISIFCLLASLISVISILWIGHQEPLFIGMAWICILGMSVNTLGTPSYFSNLGTGDVGTNTIGHALAALLAAALGWWGGWAWGAFGVGAGYVAGLAVGGLYIQVLFVRRLGLKLSSLIPAESRWLLISSVFAVGICLAADKVVLRVPYFDAPHISAQLVRMAILVAIFMLVAGSSMWMHPLRRAVSARIVETLR